MKLLVRLGLILAALALGAPSLVKGWKARSAEPPGFLIAAASPVVEPARFSASFLPRIADAPSVHAPSVCETAGGGLAAVWWGGSREGGGDVRIFLSRRGADDGGWTEPRAIMSRDQAAGQLRRRIRRIGNAVVYSPGGSELRVLFVTTTIGGWSTSSLNWMASHDLGQTWENAETLRLSPLLNISELAKNPGVRMTDGSYLFPIYHELAGKFSEALWLSEADGEVSARKTRIFGGQSAFQPSIAPVSEDEAVALCRDAGGSRRVWISRTIDRGRNWSAPMETDLPNPDAGVDVARLADGRLLLAHNDAKAGRENLTLALSEDGGRSWRNAAVVERDQGGEFSYPTLCVRANGGVELVYTWKREAIRHLSFNAAWVDQKIAEGKASK